MANQPKKIPDSLPCIQRVEAVLQPYEVLLLVRTQSYGSEGVEPVHPCECPYFQKNRTESFYVSGSGGLMCGGFRGGRGDDVKCGWLPRWILPTQRLVVEPRRPEDALDPRRRQAGRN